MTTTPPTVKSITLANLLSFGEEPQTIELRNLNVLIGPNGSGKSNVIEAIGLLQSAPRELSQAIISGGGVDEWLWKGADKTPIASIEAVIVPSQTNKMVSGPKRKIPDLRYKLSFTKEGYRFHITDEVVENELADKGAKTPYFYFRYVNGSPMLNLKSKGTRGLQREEVNPQVSILAQRKDPEHYPEITSLGSLFPQFRLYRDWEFGGVSLVREPCSVSLESEFLDEDAQNLGVVLDRLLNKPLVKREVLKSLNLFYEAATDLRTSIDGTKVQTRLEERYLRSSIPLARLSDGTVRWLSLLAILLNPDPPPLICIEEPELGLHPDMVQELGKLLIEASDRMQIIVTTHSEILLESLTEQPDSVLVCEKRQGITSVKRLEKAELATWLQRYSLGQLWRKGEIGGNRW